MKATFLLAFSQITISTKIPDSLISPRDVGALSLKRPTLHGLWQCGRGEYFLCVSLVRSYCYENGGQMQATNCWCYVSYLFPVCRLSQFSWFQSLFQQIIQDMKNGIRVTLEMEASLLLKDFHILSLLSLEGSYTGQKMCLNTHC